MKIISELQDLFSKIPNSSYDKLVSAIMQIKNENRRIFLYGVGREGIVLRAFGMRLYHLGINTSIVGCVTTPPIREKDLIIVSEGPGPGFFCTVDSIMKRALKNKSKVVLLTARSFKMRDVIVITIPAKVMHSNEFYTQSVLPMGSQYEITLWIFFDTVINMLIDEFGLSISEIEEHHTNLE